jgi:sarcosine oxidase subunit gamma
MSDRQSAMPGAHFDGHVRLRDAGLRGMITLRGDLDAGMIRKAAMDVTGQVFPKPRMANCTNDTGLCWMSPDELLVLVPHDEAATALAYLRAALAGEHHLAVDVSDARAVFTLEGEASALRETLAKLTPADMRDAALPIGQLRRTRLAQVPVAFWFQSESDAHLICFRSVADYVFGLLQNAARPGSEIGFF